MNPNFSKLKQRYRLIQAGVPEKTLPQEMTDVEVVNLLLDYVDELQDKLANSTPIIERLEAGQTWE